MLALTSSVLAFQAGLTPSTMGRHAAVVMATPNAAPVYSGQYAEELRATAAAMVQPGKGLLACDESTGTIGTRLEVRRHPATNRRRPHPSSPFAASLACWRRRR